MEKKGTDRTEIIEVLKKFLQHRLAARGKHLESLQFFNHSSWFSQQS